MGASQDNRRVLFFAEDATQFVKLRALRLALAKAGDSLDDQVVLRECARFIEATDVDFACERDSPRLRAKDLLLDQLDDRVIDGYRQLHW